MSGLHCSTPVPDWRSSDAGGIVFHVGGLRPYERAHALRMALHDSDFDLAGELLVAARLDPFPSSCWTRYVEDVICVSRQYAHRVVAAYELRCEAAARFP